MADSQTHDADVVVVGAGLAGLAARAAERAGPRWWSWRRATASAAAC